MIPDPVPGALFRWCGCTHRSCRRRIERGSDVAYRIAHLTDPHIPSSRNLWRRLRDLVRPYESASEFTLRFAVTPNELRHPYWANRKYYSNLLKKTLEGLHVLDVDHLAVTGDISHCGVPHEFAEFKGALKVADWRETPDRLTVVAGNHDRFNAYEKRFEETVDDYFDVVEPNQPRLKYLTGEIAVVEIDSNWSESLPYPEQWLPNATGNISEVEREWLRAHIADLEVNTLIVALHHHLSEDWHRGEASDYGGMMSPARGSDRLLELLDAFDGETWILHGHRHAVMEPGYTRRGHSMALPGAFFRSKRINILDISPDGRGELTQLELRT